MVLFIDTNYSGYRSEYNGEIRHASRDECSMAREPYILLVAF